MTENFPNLGRFRKCRVPNKMTQRGPEQDQVINKMPKVEDKERILKSAGEKQLGPTRAVPEDCQLLSQKKLCRLEGIGKKYSK